jgi:tRNA-specific 2-thiouridylase
VTHAKKDSTGICFIGERRFKTFLKEFILTKPGPIKDLEEKLLGSHDGLMFYTLGQRQGLGIGGINNANSEPWYVVDKDLTNNTLYVAQGSAHPRIYAQGLLCGPIHWLAECQERLPLACMAKTRYRQVEQACMISPEDNNGHCIMFSSPQRAITPGQYIVFYEKHQCLGGAVIEEIIR